MSTLEQALSSTDLPPFEGLAVRQAGLEAPGMAGGLREAMRIDPAAFHQGAHIVTIEEHVVQKVRHEPIDPEAPDGDQRRVHILRTLTVAIAADELVALVQAQLAAQAERIKRAKADAKGYGSMYDDDAHDADHTEPVDGCPKCAARAAAGPDDAAGPDLLYTERPEGMSDDEWEASAKAEPAEGTTPITKARRARGAKKGGG